MAAVNLSDLEFAYDFVSSNAMFDKHAYVCRETGRIFWTSEDDEDLDEVPDDLETSDRYVEVPDKRDLNLGRVLVMEFVGRHLPDEYDRVAGFFRGQGAYGRFKDFLDARGQLDVWHKFENEAVHNALREWCRENGLEVDEKPPAAHGGS